MTEGKAGSAGTATGRHGKYNAKGQWLEIEGRGRIWAASEAEATRLKQLVALELTGRIEDLVLQPRFELVVNNMLITRFRPDFAYYPIIDGNRASQRSIEEVKGMVLDDYRLRMKLFEALFPDHKVTIIKPGRKLGSTALWMDHHWKDRLPNDPT